MKTPKSIVAFVSIAVMGIFLLVHYSSGHSLHQQQQSQQPQESQQPTPSTDQTKDSGPTGSTEAQTIPTADLTWLPNHRVQTIRKDKADVIFIDSKHGWKMVPGQGAMNSEPAVIYQTTDGGKSWVKITAANQKKVSASESTNLPAGTLPYEGVKNGLSFINSSTGWITGYSPRIGYQWIFVTYDGGNSWVHQELPVPKTVSQYTSMSFDLTPPTFFNSKDGILVEIIANAPQSIAHPPHYVFLFTHDGGQHWEEQSPSNGVSLKFPDSDPNQAGQSFMAIVNGITWYTTDGGYDWAKKVN